MNKKSWNLAISGESMVTRRFSMYDEPGFLSIMRNFQDADISFTHLEMLLHEQVTAPLERPSIRVAIWEATQR